MTTNRREFVAAAAAGAMTLAFGGAGCSTTSTRNPAMHGLIGSMKALPGQRDALIAALLEGSGDMPGCLSYVVARDAKDADVLWVTEVWDSAESHKASLSLPSVKAAIERGKPLIASFGQYVEVVPVGGHGLA